MTKPKKVRTLHIGDAHIRTNNNRHSKWRDPYHFILTLSWPQFFAVLVTVFLTINFLFASFYWLIPNSVNNAKPDDFFDYFFFSIETLATVGYGFMSPANFAAHIVASIEILMGMMTIALTTGLIFVRFSKPTARIMFSERPLIGRFDGKPALMLRVANERHNRIVEANAKLSLVRDEINSVGEIFARIYDLQLTRERTPIFALTWTLVHIINEQSPLYQLNAKKLAEVRTRIIVSFTGHDETMSATVYAIKNYSAENVIFNGRFVDILTNDEKGVRVVDLTRFHDIELIKDE